MLVIILVALKKSYAETIFASRMDTPSIHLSHPIEFGEPRSFGTSADGTATRMPGDNSHPAKSLTGDATTSSGIDRAS